MSVQWRRLPTSDDRPAARAYHSMTCVGSRYLLFGGFDGKSTYGDLWWLVPEGTVSNYICNVFRPQTGEQASLFALSWLNGLEQC